MKRRCIMPTFGYLPYQGWAFLFIFLTLKHFPVNFLHLSEEKCNFAKKRNDANNIHIFLI